MAEIDRIICQKFEKKTKNTCRCFKMDIDNEKIITLVEARPALYNFTLKEHHNRQLIDKLWLEISEEIGEEVTDCKIRWNSLRNAYTRYLREDKKLPSGSGTSKRKKWYLADCLTFLKDFVGQHRKSASNVAVEEQSEEIFVTGTIINEDDNTIDLPLINDVRENDSSSISSSANAAPTRTTPKRKYSALEAVTRPMINCLKTRTLQNQPIPSMGLTGKFLDSLVRGVEKLSSKRQRLFKSKVLEILNNLTRSINKNKQKKSRLYLAD